MDVETLELFARCWLVQSIWKTVWRFLKMLTAEFRWACRWERWEGALGQPLLHCNLILNLVKNTFVGDCSDIFVEGLKAPLFHPRPWGQGQGKKLQEAGGRMFSGDVMRAGGLVVPCSRHGPSGSRVCDALVRAGCGTVSVRAVSVGRAVPEGREGPCQGTAPLLDGQWGCSAKVGARGDRWPQGVAEALDSAGRHCFGNSPPTPVYGSDSRWQNKIHSRKIPRILVLSARGRGFQGAQDPQLSRFGARFQWPAVTASPGEGQGCAPVRASPGWAVQFRAARAPCVWHTVVPEITSFVRGEDPA